MATDIMERAINEEECKVLINQWAKEVYNKWNDYNKVVDNIAKGFLNI